MRLRRVIGIGLGALALLGTLVVGAAWWREHGLASTASAASTTSVSSAPGASGPAPVAASASGMAAADVVSRGAYLARIGNCAGCHTARGGAPLAGGVPLGTRFGTLYSSNLTPDPETGLGRWSEDDFWAAMHHGRSREGRLLYPAFPYGSYTGLTREDSDAIFAWLRAQAPVRQAVPSHQLGWPYRWQTSLAVWRLLYFRPVDQATSTRQDDGLPSAQRSASMSDATVAARGRYLVEVLGHCAECHAPRNRLGALRDAPRLRGGWVGDEGWWAPSLADPQAAGLQDWREDEIAAWLRSGWSERGAALGPMADVVADSLQYLSDADAAAMARHLHQLPRETEAAPAFKAASPTQTDLGRRVYARHCADCHGEQGQGRRIDGAPAYPPLAGNRAVTLASPQNLLQMLAHGGYAPTTPAHPRPFGMPPLRQTLSEAEMAAVASYVRQSWGHRASLVTEQDVLKLR
ncbi:c-type cytochrome [Roseateles amylovorans]|uniref:Cytochrome c n=1 Tax=Roseateles amylovorans TaxID=2978473 RepID=A0ABY6B205_9BURK|nr:cytochrome c [Roseateles amylovorans]UXH79243.1 cytochrome c [Roseateles amylovorans]